MKASRAKLSLAKTDTTPVPAPVEPPVLRIVPATPVPAILEFQPDAVELEQRPPPRLARMALYGILFFVACVITWASLSSIDEIVVAPGKLITTRPMLVVQPLETSVIRSIEVKVGDTVHAGQTLATLDPTFATADSKQLLGKIQGFDSQIERIEAELAGKTYAVPQDARADQLLQAQLFSQRKAFYDAKLRDYDTQIAHAEATLAASHSEEAVLVKRLAGLHEIDQMRETLFDQGTGSRLSYLQGRDVSLDLEAGIGRIRGNQLETAQTLEQAKAERQAFMEDFRRASMENLVELRDSRGTAAEELKKAELRQQMAVLTAPADAAVLDIAQRSIGSVVRDAEPLFTLVPLDVPLEAEVAVAAKDIGQIASDDTARVKFDAFPFQKHGTADGKVRNISQDAFAPGQQAEQHQQNTAPFYKVRVALGDMNLRNLPQGFRLIPGMTVQAEIKTGQRTIISYFLYPLLRGLDESLHEP
jgi:HlyD family secretion protein